MINRKNKIDFPYREGVKGKKKYVTQPVGMIRIAIYVPSTTNYNRQIKDSVFKKRIQETMRLLNRFGGSTQYLGLGGFNSKNKVITEKVGIVESYVQKDMYRKMDVEIYNWLKNKCKKENWYQEAIGFIYDGKLFYIS